MTLQIDEYQELTGETEIYSSAAKAFETWPVEDREKMLMLMYCTGKLNGEAGEIAELVFKSFRGPVENFNAKIEKEFGDVLWYIARLTDLCGFSLEQVMQANLDKLKDRKERGVLHGFGDER